MGWNLDEQASVLAAIDLNYHRQSPPQLGPGKSRSIDPPLPPPWPSF
ncbi:hypothetical protein RchiOBHm_Chr3g0481281 [Rosa chinensis]|uniref:Uncharacterized protein n=1 Tax=Rosa chinensis TaxID=74649 RepID=A0A2P6RDY7_ROSCH|nr:hypothetical protein RchiOBHm_Chr3g0481281 [Rosa chinensis]